MPLAKDHVEFLIHSSEEMQIALANFTGDILYHFPKGKLWDCFRKQQFVINDILAQEPLKDAPTVFTDGSKTKSAYWMDSHYWVQPTDFGSVQQNELAAVIQVFKDFPGDVNLVADSAYVVGVLQNIHNAVTYSPKDVLLKLFQQLQQVLQQRNARFYVTHIRSHSSLPGPLTFGNNQVDQLVAFVSPKEDHAHYHCSAGHLHIKYKIPYSLAKQIAKACPICRPLHLRIVPAGVNPRGLQPNELWQMNVTHIASLGRSSYVHVTLDTYSKFLWETALTGKTSHHVISHLIETFAVIGIPAKIKTDNGPACTSNKFKQFCEFYDIKHITGIEYNPQGQAMIEHVHGTLKLQIKNLKGGR